MKKMMLIMVMMLTIVVSTNGKNYTDKKNEVLVSFGISVNNHSITDAKGKCKTCCCHTHCKCKSSCKYHKKKSNDKRMQCTCKKCQKQTKSNCKTCKQNMPLIPNKKR